MKDESDFYISCKNSSQKELNAAFLKACEHGELNKVKYLLTSPELELHADIHCDNNWGLATACDSGHMNIVQYLLTSPDLKEHADIHAHYSYALNWACASEKFEIARYLLTSSELTEHANVHLQSDILFKSACLGAKTKLLEFLIFEINIQRTDEINEHLRNKPNEEAEKMFRIRELNEKLNHELQPGENISKKSKI